MNTRPDERLPYLELARQGARVVRSVQAGDLSRLAEVAPGHGAMRVELDFRLGEHGHPWVSGSVEAVVDATCQVCLEQFGRPLRAVFELCIVKDPALASEIASGADVLVADTDSVTIADVVEDELILTVPERLCTKEPCPYAPALRYPAPDAPEPEAEKKENPFHVLSVLKR